MKRLIFFCLLILLFSFPAFSQSVPGAPNFPTSQDDLTSLLNAANNATGRLSTTISSGDTTFILNSISDAANFPSTGCVTIDTEILCYTSKSSATFSSVVRAKESTSAATHNAGAAVNLRITAQYHNGLANTVILIEAKIGADSSSPTTIGNILTVTSSGHTSWQAPTGITASSTNMLTNKTIASTTDILGGVTMTLGSDATGDIYYRNSSGVLTRLAIGASTTVLHGGTNPGYSQVAAATDISGTLPVNRGGTGQAGTFTDKTLPFISSGIYAQSQVFYDLATSRLGIGSGNTSPSFNLSFGSAIGGTNIGNERSAGSGNGFSLAINGGAAPSGFANRLGGTLNLNGGLSTGSGTSTVSINGYTVGGSGSTDNASTTYATFTASGETLTGDWLPSSNGGSNVGNASFGIKQLFVDYTNTAGGTTGAQTINKASGSVNFAAAATSLVVTNSLVSTNSNIQCTVATNDSTMKSVQCVAGSGSFTIFANAAATAETRVRFHVIGN